MPTITSETEKFHGMGNAVHVVKFIQDELPPLSWNIIAMKIIKSLIKLKIRAMSITPTDEFPEELLLEIDEVMMQNYKKHLPL